MIYKGLKYRRSKQAVMLPKEYWLGEQKNYITFGRVCKSTENNAVRTEYFFRDELPIQYWVSINQPDPDMHDAATPLWCVWAKPVQCKGHSLTNLMYGTDGIAYLVYDGIVYVRSLKG